jgi:cysteine synthase A
MQKVQKVQKVQKTPQNHPITKTHPKKLPKSTQKEQIHTKNIQKRHNTTRKIVTNNVFENFSDAVGNTPLIKLQFASKLTGCNIYGKAEYMNVGGSVKDRAAKYIIENAEKEGLLIPGKPGIIVEATAGNTGIGLSLCGNSKGYRTIIVIPETQTEEKKTLLRTQGAALIENPALPFVNPNNYTHVARRLSILLRQKLKHKNIPVFYANQWDNTINARAHEETTAVEIYEQLKSIGQNIDGFNAAIGTGGTLVGTSRGLRQLTQNNVKIALTDPLGALPYNYYKNGQAVMGQGSSITEGIGQSRITGNLALDWKPDYCYEISDNDALHMLNRLMYEEGLPVGLSTGINVAGAIKFAQELGPGHNIVTILADSAAKYGSKLYNLPFLESKGLPIPFWLDKDFGVGGKDGGVVVVDRGRYGINEDVNLLPELVGEINIKELVDEVMNNHDIK